MVATAAFLLLVGAGRCLLGHACHGSTKLGEVTQRVSHAVHSAFSSVFGGIKALLSAIFSWETLFWFLAAGALLTWAVTQNHPDRIPGWIDAMDLERSFNSPTVLVTLVPILLVLIAVGRMQGVHWHSRQMGIVGLLLAAVGLIWLLRHARMEMPPEPVAIVDETIPTVPSLEMLETPPIDAVTAPDQIAVQVLEIDASGDASAAPDQIAIAESPTASAMISGEVHLDNEPVSGATVVFEGDDGTTTTGATDDAGRFDLEGSFERHDETIQGIVRINEQPVSGATVVFEGSDGTTSTGTTDEAGHFELVDTPVEASGSVQSLDPIDDAAATELQAATESSESAVGQELETVKIEVIDSTGHSREVDNLPAWVEAARNSANLRTIAADTQWGSSSMGVWMEANPEEAARHAPTGTMLYGEVATLNESQFEGEYVATVEHVGSIDDGAVFARFAADLLAYDRLYEYFPDMRHWVWSPQASKLHQNFVIEQCIETSMLHVGDFQEPVYTVHARIVVHQSQDLAAFNQLKKDEQRRRIAMAGVGVGSLAWLFTVVAAYLRINVATGGRRRKWLLAGGIAVAMLPFVGFAVYA
jgi:hypothetical protein